MARTSSGSGITPDGAAPAEIVSRLEKLAASPDQRPGTRGKLVALARSLVPRAGERSRARLRPVPPPDPGIDPDGTLGSQVVGESWKGPAGKARSQKETAPGGAPSRRAPSGPSRGGSARGRVWFGGELSGPSGASGPAAAALERLVEQATTPAPALDGPAGAASGGAGGWPWESRPAGRGGRSSVIRIEEHERPSLAGRLKVGPVTKPRVSAVEPPPPPVGVADAGQPP
jgi:hypothetical protein